MSGAQSPLGAIAGEAKSKKSATFANESTPPLVATTLSGYEAGDRESKETADDDDGQEEEADAYVDVTQIDDGDDDDDVEDDDDDEEEASDEAAIAVVNNKKMTLAATNDEDDDDDDDEIEMASDARSSSAEAAVDADLAVDERSIAVAASD